MAHKLRDAQTIVRIYVVRIKYRVRGPCSSTPVRNSVVLSATLNFGTTKVTILGPDTRFESHVDALSVVNVELPSVGISNVHAQHPFYNFPTDMLSGILDKTGHRTQLATRGPFFKEHGPHAESKSANGLQA